MAKVTLSGYIIVPEHELEKIQHALVTHITLTREEPGCIKFIVVQDDSHMHRFNVYEEFESEDAFDAHQDRVKNSDWGKIARNVERHYTIEK
ncbi:antibiotic biosynthesis monooxygenase [Veronia nyctiphanis]|uniref:Antibiotic biosynthesis monooxygenase n=1 Tax=Veronia nyctiphanis TaxID=1278244 RepID=A0A4V1LT85_9GAMM|nr:antibiotic biosynthesis monooxygenase [Veronia nyctiphanis]RXJ74318.1 antibiotic biosynthesis monooxygenase [Veronia nyctiphanis]